MAALTPTFGWLDLPEYRGWAPGDPDVPDRTSLLEPGTDGDRLHVSGRVLTKSGAPLADVKLEFWHADANGHYAMAEYKFRGTQRTDADGSYNLETVLPGYAGQIRHINYLARLTIRGRKQPLHLRAAIYFATEGELNSPITAAERDYVVPHARKHADDPSYLSLNAIPIRDRIRLVTYDIVFDVD